MIIIFFIFFLLFIIEIFCIARNAHFVLFYPICMQKQYVMRMMLFTTLIVQMYNTFLFILTSIRKLFVPPLGAICNAAVPFFEAVSKARR